MTDQRKQSLWVWALALGLLALAMVKIGAGAVMAGKAWLSPLLLDRAFRQATATGQPVAPWSWSDARIIGALSYGVSAGASAGDETAFIQQDLIPVLGDGRHRAMAFAPISWTMGAARIVVAHRDTHFAHIGGLQPGDLVRFRTLSDAGNRFFRVSRIWVADKDALLIPGGGAGAGILLVTCYPFGRLEPGGRQRFLVWAEPA